MFTIVILQSEPIQFKIHKQRRYALMSHSHQKAPPLSPTEWQNRAAFGVENCKTRKKTNSILLKLSWTWRWSFLHICQCLSCTVVFLPLGGNLRWHYMLTLKRCTKGKWGYWVYMRRETAAPEKRQYITTNLGYVVCRWADLCGLLEWS